MTHTLHRRGSLDSLENDFCWLVYYTKSINDKNILEKFRQVTDIAIKAGSVNWGDIKSGSILEKSKEELMEKLTVLSRVRGTFTSQEQVIDFLRMMKKADLELSITISGLMDKVFDACKRVGLKPHSVNLSLGVWGKKELLPSEEILEVTTMCGHHMVSPRLVEELVKDVRNGRISAEEVGVKLAQQCPCGVFNQVRASKLVQKMVKKLP